MPPLSKTKQTNKTKLDAKAWFDFKADARAMVRIRNKIWKNFGAKVGEAKQAAYRISSYKALPRIIPATLIMPSAGTLLCR